MANGKKSTRKYAPETVKLLWGRAAGRCAFPDCRIEVFDDDSEHDPVVNFGEMAHVSPSSDDGPRSVSDIPVEERDKYDNLILLCRNCHKKVDTQTVKYNCDILKKMKHDHETWVRDNLPERGKGKRSWIAITLQDKIPIDFNEAITALEPDYPADNSFVLDIGSGGNAFDKIYTNIALRIARVCQEKDSFDCRFAVFPLSSITSCISLGHILTNRPRVRLFQYHRTEQKWQWNDETDYHYKINVTGIPEETIEDNVEIALCFDISENIHDKDVFEVRKDINTIIHISIPKPSKLWLSEERQLFEVIKATNDVFERCMSSFPNATKWHLFCAVPAPIAVAIGQQINPTMFPCIQLYEFMKSRAQRYLPSLLLKGDSSG